MLNGDIRLKLKEGIVNLEVLKKGYEVMSIPMEDDYYDNDQLGFAAELMGQCIQIISELTSEKEMVEAIQEELESNYNIKLEVLNEN